MNGEDLQKTNILKDGSQKQDVFKATTGALDSLRQTFDYYKEVLGLFGMGESKVELRKRYMLRQIDEAWVRAVEDTLPSIDVVIRRPNVSLQDEEEILPIEMTRRITDRSVIHLSQHTDYITEIRKDGTVVPSKLLNVYQDETVFTYENKFVNTLISRLYAFVMLRYDGALACGEDEKNTLFALNQEFSEGERHGKINLSIEISEPPEQNLNIKNYFYTSDLWKRVEKIVDVLKIYMSSPFVAMMGKNYVKSPVMRTNILLKNVEFNQCLSLWEFLEQYDDAGYQNVVQENLESLDEEYLKDIYNSVVAQYVVFKNKIGTDFDEAKTLDSRVTESVTPKVISDLDEFNEREFDFKEPQKPQEKETTTEMEFNVEQAIRIALAADEKLFSPVQKPEPEKETVPEPVVISEEDLRRYEYSFLARLILAQLPTQEYYSEFKNILLSHEGVKSNISWEHELFSVGRRKVCQMKMKGKTLCLYLPLDPDYYKVTKFVFEDERIKKPNTDLPFMIRVKTNRAAKYACELLNIVMTLEGLEPIDGFTPVQYRYPPATVQELLQREPPLVKEKAGKMPVFASKKPLDDVVSVEKKKAETEEKPTLEVGQDTKTDTVVEGDGTTDVTMYSYTFTARLIQADKSAQARYSCIKNRLLSYDRVRSNVSNKCDSFRYGRQTVAKIKIKGKNVTLTLLADATEFENTKYRVKPVLGKDGTPENYCTVKVVGGLSLKHAEELIDGVMRKLGATQGEIPTTDYSLPYRTTEELIANDPPLVKVGTRRIKK